MMIDSNELKSRARDLGFDLCGVARPKPPPHAGYLDSWLKAGCAGDMSSWMARAPEVRANPGRLMPQARSVIVLGVNYHQTAPPRRGRIAQYALGRDYHDWIPPRLQQLSDWMESLGGQQRLAVDTSALLEKPLGVAAGLGWQGKSTILIHRRLGTWFFLAELLTTLEFRADPEEGDHCGACRRCLDVCPTGAITAPYQLDARRCISYLTIEHKGAIPHEFRRAIGDHLYGCDDCLDVCPWNRWAQPTVDAEMAAVARPDLAEMLDWDDATFRTAFRGTPIFRLKRARWLRNIAVVLGNIGTARDLPALRRACVDPDPLVSEHAQWAIAEIEGRLEQD